jgi:hypothetical protein
MRSAISGARSNSEESQVDSRKTKGVAVGMGVEVGVPVGNGVTVAVGGASVGGRELGVGDGSTNSVTIGCRYTDLDLEQFDLARAHLGT